jgi:hypothetical protein
MIALVLALTAALALIVLIVVEMSRARPKRASVPIRALPRRQPMLEERIRDAFTGPREKYGDVFLSYEIWRRDHEIRMELRTTQLFAQLNEFTRCLIVRHLWRALERIATGSVVIVDSPPQTWTRAIDDQFEDHGIDPWGRITELVTGGAAFIKET